ncbi:DUF2274 domain-containing protein [Pigmentiphaga sp. YJ18]|uniref:DUF2274 domain-containing protein n=1 Tax=Pigmentiphaga sp. YJ18 TaxID=3134907 RepID=UPI00405488A3
MPSRRAGPCPRRHRSHCLKTDLGRYAALHAQAYGEAVDAEKLIPHMLEAFMAGDRGFKGGGRQRRSHRRSEAWRKTAARVCAILEGD